MPFAHDLVENHAQVFRREHAEVGIFFRIRAEHGRNGNFLVHVFVAPLLFLFGVFGDDEVSRSVEADGRVLVGADSRIERYGEADFVRRARDFLQEFRFFGLGERRPAFPLVLDMYHGVRGAVRDEVIGDRISENAVHEREQFVRRLAFAFGLQIV